VKVCASPRQPGRPRAEQRLAGRRAPLGIPSGLEIPVDAAKRGERFELLHHVRVFQIVAVAEEG